MTKEQATQSAALYVSEQARLAGMELVLLRERTIELPYGWVFFYDTRKYVESGNELMRAVGNAPILIESTTGQLHVLGTGRPVAESLKIFEQRRRDKASSQQ